MASQQELETIWRNKLARAWAQYENAKEKCRVRSDEWHLDLTPSPDGGHAFRTAQQEESAALREYMRVMRVITDFVVRGRKLPEQE